jgi:alkylation response protein AidB-like acyl-CoA dehydrogenase
MGHVFRTPEQAEAVDNLRRFLDRELEPKLAAGGSNFIPREEMVQFTRELVNFGLVSSVIDESHGGTGLGWLTHLMLFEELAYSSNDLAMVILINAIGASMLEELAPSPLRERYLPGLLSGDRFISIAVSEPEAGSNVAAIKCRARKEGDAYIVSGEKTWISNGMYSDVMICTCRTHSDPKRGLTALLLDRKEHPYEVRNIHKMALNRQSTARIFIDEARVPHTNMIGKEGEALKNTLSMFERARLHVGALSLGIARRALDESVRYAKERRQHGKLLAAHQLTAAKLADMATQIDAARLLIHRAAQMIDAGIRADMEAAMAKYFATEAAVGICRQAVQIHGGAGVTADFPVERLAREAIILPIPDGTTEIQQLIIGRALTGISAI